MSGGVVAHVVSYHDNEGVLFIETKGEESPNCSWEIECLDSNDSKWTRFGCIARTKACRDFLLAVFTSYGMTVRAVAIVREVAFA